MAKTFHQYSGLDAWRQVRAFRKEPLAAMAEMRATHGDLVYFPWPLRTALVFHPDAIKDLLLRKPGTMIKGSQTNQLKKVIGDGLFAREGQPWRRQRRLIGPVFQPSAMAGYRAAIQRRTLAQCDAWPTGVAFDLGEAMGRLAFAVAGDLFFGGLPAALAPVLQEIAVAAGALIFRKIASALPLPFWVPTPAHRRFRAGMRLLDQTVYQIVSDRRRSQASRPDLLGQILSADQALTDTEIRDEVVTLLIAGFETTSSMLAWTLHLLALHPEHLERLAAEAALPTPETTQLLATLKETLRLYPPSPLISRQNVAPTDVGGHHFAAGTNFVMSQYLVHRDERFWKDAARFDPGRFLGPELPKHAYLPFSLGPRRCIGEDLAYAEGVTILSLLLRHFRVELDPAERRPICEVILRIDRPVMARLTRLAVPPGAAPRDEDREQRLPCPAAGP